MVMVDTQVEEFLENLKAMRSIMSNLRKIQRQVPNQAEVVPELDKISSAIVQLGWLVQGKPE